MHVKMILPSLTEAHSPLFRPIKYSLFPPLGLATLAAYLGDEDEVTLQDEHVEPLDLDDAPDLVVIQVYITSAYRAYQLADHYRARGAYVVLGGLHVTSLPDEAALHADTVFLGPGLRSLFVGFETLNPANLREQGKLQNLNRDYAAAIRRLHDHGVMVNGSFVFGMDSEDPGVFDRTVDWGISQGIETATFHILTPYPGTALYARMAAEGRVVHRQWDLYDTRHVVYRPARLAPEVLEAGYWRAYDSFYRWSAIFRGAATKHSIGDALRHIAYADGWKKFEPLWDLVIRAKRVSSLLPALETVLSGASSTARRVSAARPETRLALPVPSD